MIPQLAEYVVPGARILIMVDRPQRAGLAAGDECIVRGFDGGNTAVVVNEAQPDALS